MKKGDWCPVTKVSALLVLVGALNWGLVGAFEWNLVEALLGAWPVVERVVYVVVGVAGLFLLGKCGMGCKSCK